MKKIIALVVLIVTIFFVGTIDCFSPDDKDLLYNNEAEFDGEDISFFYKELDQKLLALEHKRLIDYEKSKNLRDYKYLYNLITPYLADTKKRDSFLKKRISVLNNFLNLIDRYSFFKKKNIVNEFNYNISLSLLIILKIDAEVDLKKDTSLLIKKLFKNLSFLKGYFFQWSNEFYLITNYFSENLDKFSKTEEKLIVDFLKKIDTKIPFRYLIQQSYTSYKLNEINGKYLPFASIYYYRKHSLFIRYVFHKNRYRKKLIDSYRFFLDSNFIFIMKKDIITNFKLPRTISMANKKPFPVNWFDLLIPQSVNRYYLKECNSVYRRREQIYFASFLSALEKSRSTLLLLSKKESSKR